VLDKLNSYAIIQFVLTQEEIEMKIEVIDLKIPICSDTVDLLIPHFKQLIKYTKSIEKLCEKRSVKSGIPLELKIILYRLMAAKRAFDTQNFEDCDSILMSA
jgi:hypothetical protein